MTKKFFIKTLTQQQWLEQLHTLKPLITEQAQHNDENAAFPYKAIEALRNIGYTKLTLPKQYGGEGFTIYDAILLQETLASYDGSTALILTWTLQNVGDIFEQQQWPKSTLEQFAQQIQQGAMINKAVSEFAMGSPVRGGRPQTTAVQLKNEWIINGRKNYMTGSFALDYFLTLAWIEEKETTGFFLLPKNTTGISIEETWDVSAMRSTGSHDLVLENVTVPADALVEIPSYTTGFKLNSWLLLIPATYLGIAQAARDYAVQFAKTHSPNSIQGTIAELPNIQALIGEMELELMKARYALYGAAEVCQDPKRQPDANVINSAKHIVTNSALHIVDLAMRTVGAKSLERNNPLQRYYRDVRAGLHNPPMDDLTLKSLAKTALQQLSENSRNL